ncbi:MAG: C4-type zinc ribbon domain-containing protein [Desulfuromonadaceae bacterium]|nr:C4-type zinc ribbon domain-containing protein [Desulfuromonadaceae bacterium]MDD2849764.1 C4-type zinc ribbon domain-containing protein [Desulfuromonadaceae bacterium]MDD4130736.1 C4-type zinc ribbon domain-containing protein [Desulfuromonadaceae bacterium]
MKKKLDMLEELQEVDQLIDTLKASQSGLQAELSGINQGVDAAREEVEAIEARLAQCEAEKSGMESTHAAELENISRSETNMKEIKTNKEFQAIGREITAARKQLTDIEEQLLQKISLIEELSSELAAKKGRCAELTENSAQRIVEKQAEIDKIQSDINADIERRESVAKEMPASLVKKFTILREQRRGRALAIARDGYCMGCNMHLPPQLYNNLYKYEELLTCPHCQRILILKLQQQ